MLRQGYGKPKAKRWDRVFLPLEDLYRSARVVDWI